MGLFSAKCTSVARLDGKTAVITGSNTGIGKVTAKDFFKRGARVIMACRNKEKATAACDDIRKECHGMQNLGDIGIAELDLGSLKSVRECALKLIAEESEINLLVNNAGVMACPLMRTEDNFEMQMGTNHLGHFLFTLLLMPKIRTSTPARIINVSSVAHNGGPINFEDINYEKRRYSALAAYKQSKLANILFTKELTKKIQDANIQGINTYTLHPGVIKTELGRHLDMTYFKGMRWLFSTLGAPFYKNVEQGAQTTIHCAVSEDVSKETGLYYAECKPTNCSSEANDMKAAEILWTTSLKLVGLGENYDPFN